MKYTSEIEINKPRETVVALFDNPDNMKEWMPGLISFEALSGTPGQKGAKSKLKFDMNGRKIEMIETITVRNLPDEFSGTYEAKGVWNSVSNRFIALSADKTKWVIENEFKFSGFMMKLIGFLMPGAFKKTSMKYLELFKAFAERS
ncbi:MAG: SRPBCC family protein [Chitinophagales bacterium]